jgi:8-oxo-dGTP pyrophosphatase MutT (NUDIX family)
MTNHTQLPLWDDKSPDEKLEALREQLEDLYRFVLAEPRRKLLAILNRATPADDKEGADIYMMKRMVQQYSNNIAPNCEVGHITGSALVIDVSSGCVVLHYHKKLNRWLQFGGHADFETDFANVAMREAREETGLRDLRHYPTSENPAPLDFDIHTIPATDYHPEHLHLDFRYLLATNQSHLLQPAENESQQFITPKFHELLQPTDPDDETLLDLSLKRLIRKAHDVYDKTSGRTAL